MTELMTVAAAVLAIGAGGRSAGRRLWSVIWDVMLERSCRKTMIAVLSTVAWMPGCAQVSRVNGRGGFWVAMTCSPALSDRELGQGLGG